MNKNFINLGAEFTKKIAFSIYLYKKTQMLRLTSLKNKTAKMRIEAKNSKTEKHRKAWAKNELTI